jgi:hypothetical protein
VLGVTQRLAGTIALQIQRSMRFEDESFLALQEIHAVRQGISPVDPMEGLMASSGLSINPATPRRAYRKKERPLYRDFWFKDKKIAVGR